ncbi:MAG TPA: MBL fold metallo-hydrolase RNA specificity domain-containing protein, partial [Patescibacteria group bacterium]|nr:MBL fold metallo-hydrolase RNA specificity domain-containing protein [Patescibacteria group bacterium]
CKVYSIEGFSGHADQKGLLDWIGAFKKKPAKVFLVHGEEEALKELSRKIETELGISNEIAQLGQTIELTAAAHRPVVVERSGAQKESLKSSVSDIRREFNETLDDLLISLSCKGDIKLDTLLYAIEKLQTAVADVKKEIN